MTTKVKASTLAFAGYFLTVLPALAAGGTEGEQQANQYMVIIMWACLFTLIIIGGKIAWGPILEKVDVREKRIGDALDNAEKVKQELADAQAKSQEILDKATTEAAKAIGEARANAEKLSVELNEKARKDAEAISTNALKEIENARNAALGELKQQSAELAISLAGKVLKDQLDTAKGQALTTQLIEQI